MFVTALVLTLATATPAVTPLPVGTPPARMTLLKPGTHRYLRYSVKDGRRSTTDIWTRTVSFEPQDGVRRLHIVMQWDGVVPPAYTSKQDAWFDAATFRPLTHLRTLEREGKISVGGYRFQDGAIIGMKELPNNGRADFTQVSPEPAFNFEYDMELLQTLPWRRGYVADLVFYDPGLEPPKHYLFRQAGEEAITGPDGRKIDCWVVTADYNTGKVVNRFWFAKAGQVLLHEEGEKDGVIYVKTLLGAEASEHI